MGTRQSSSRRPADGTLITTIEGPLARPGPGQAGSTPPAPAVALALFLRRLGLHEPGLAACVLELAYPR